MPNSCAIFDNFKTSRSCCIGESLVCVEPHSRMVLSREVGIFWLDVLDVLCPLKAPCGPKEKGQGSPQDIFPVTCWRGDSHPYLESNHATGKCMGC